MVIEHGCVQVRVYCETGDSLSLAPYNVLTSQPYLLIPPRSRKSS
jgi:ATP adenylyltransferase/5',5'''-P-1,P-4-tetraphosphate phosphorylase II